MVTRKLKPETDKETIRKHPTTQMSSTPKAQVSDTPFHRRRWRYRAAAENGRGPRGIVGNRNILQFLKTGNGWITER